MKGWDPVAQWDRAGAGAAPAVDSWDTPEVQVRAVVPRRGDRALQVEREAAEREAAESERAEPERAESEPELAEPEPVV